MLLEYAQATSLLVTPTLYPGRIYLTVQEQLVYPKVGRHDRFWAEYKLEALRETCVLDFAPSLAAAASVFQQQVRQFTGLFIVFACSNYAFIIILLLRIEVLPSYR